MEKTRVGESKKTTWKKSEKEVLLNVLTSTEEDFFIEKLWENSEDFLYLKTLVKEVAEVTWKKLLKAVNIEVGEIEWIYWDDELVLTETNIKNLGKFKRIEKLDIRRSKLENLGELKAIWEFHAEGSDLKSLWKVNGIGIFWWEWANINLQIDIITKKNNWEFGLRYGNFGWQVEWIKKITEMKIIPGNLNLGDVEMESLGKIERIEWYFIAPIGCKKIWNLKSIKIKMNLKNTWIDLQLAVIKRINAGLLELVDDLEFGGNILWIEKFLEIENIPWQIDIDSMRFEDKLIFINKINAGKLTVEWTHCDILDRYIYIYWEPGELPSCTNGYFPRIWLDTDLEDKSIKFWEKSLSNVRNMWYDEKEENFLVDEWMWNKMKEYYLESIKNYKWDNLEKLKKEKDSFFKKTFPDLFMDNVVSMEKYRSK